MVSTCTDEADIQGPVLRPTTTRPKTAAASRDIFHANLDLQAATEGPADSVVSLSEKPVCTKVCSAIPNKIVLQSETKKKPQQWLSSKWLERISHQLPRKIRSCKT
mmetsp:Transcript_54744/g.108962  ORF Transcript_54744/g.108962 Transcript_54744/m.108962 type:complete len:106 (-) Transcript_54744:40-357(-)